MVSWLAKAAGDVVRHTALTFADLAGLTDEQILVLAASAAREAAELDGKPRSSGPVRAEGFQTEEQLKANYLQLGRLLGMSPEQAELEFQACKERGARFEPGGR